MRWLFALVVATTALFAPRSGKGTPGARARAFPLPAADGWKAAGHDGVRGVTIGPIENGYHPGVGYGTTALGMGLAAYLPFRGARGPALAYNRSVDDIATRWRGALDRANDMSLTLPQRRQAAQEAVGLRQQFNTARANVPEGVTVGDRLRTGAVSGLIADAGIMAPDLFDYIYSMGDPTGALHSSSLSQLNPASNPGRVAAGFLGGAAFGGARLVLRAQ